MRELPLPLSPMEKCPHQCGQMRQAWVRWDSFKNYQNCLLCNFKVSVPLDVRIVHMFDLIWYDVSWIYIMNYYELWNYLLESWYNLTIWLSVHTGRNLVILQQSLPVAMVFVRLLDDKCRKYGNRLWKSRNISSLCASEGLNSDQHVLPNWSKSPPTRAI
jgi:hypothetical protein